MWVEANRFQQLRLLNAKIKKHWNAFSKTPLDRFIDKNHNSHVINGINSMCDIYGTVWRTFLMGFMTSEGTSELLNCCAMRLNRAYVIAHSHNGGGGWRLECKRTAEQSNSLIKIPHNYHQLCAIRRVLLTTLLRIKSRNARALYGQFCSLFFQLSED